MLPDCGGFVTGNIGQMNSPNYPLNYNANDACDWFITGDAASGNRIIFLITDIDTEEGYDGLTIKDGFSANSQTLLSYSGAATNLAVLSNGLQVYVGFFADSSYQQRGFNATWQVVNFAEDKPIDLAAYLH